MSSETPDTTVDPAETTQPAPTALESERAPESDPSECPNCGATPHGTFCAACGQNNRAERLSFREISKHGFEHFVELDMPIARTVVGMTLRPGRTCREYVEGHRRRYSNPIRYCVIMTALYLICLAVFNISPSESVALSVGASKKNPDGTVSRLTTTTVQRDEATPSSAGTAPVAVDDGPGSSTVTPERRQRIADYIANNARLLIERNINWLAFFSIPIAVGAFSLLFRKRGYTYAEQLAWGYFVFGHLFLYSAIFAALGAFRSAWHVLAIQTVEIGYVVWAVAGFYRYSFFGSLWRTLLGYLAYTIGTMIIGMIVVIVWATWLIMSGEILNRV